MAWQMTSCDRLQTTEDRQADRQTTLKRNI